MARIILTGDGQAYRHFTVTADHEVTGDTIKLSFSTPYATAPDADFHDAAVTSVTKVGGRWVVEGRLLFGADPGSLALPPGRYKVFGKLIGTPERPIESMGYLRVT